MRIEDRVFDRRETFDVFIASCGYETRSSYCCRLGVQALEKIALTYGDDAPGAVLRNMQEYTEADWVLLDAEWFCSSLGENSLAEKRVAVDISSMPRRVLGNVTRSAVASNASSITFVYCPASYGASAAVAQQADVLSAGPLGPDFRGPLRPSSLPISLIVGLGLEPYRALGIIELVEPARTWAFSATSDDSRFSQGAQAVNRPLVTSLQGKPIYQYDIHSLADTYLALDSLCFSLSSDSRVLLAPSGPKVFSLACILVSLYSKQPAPAVWRVGGKGGWMGIDVMESGEVIAYTLIP
ncbi:hypothetical protein LX13_003721 [Williamsia maris]|uniref:Uncharacterized protein n=1 Tax=Williamsia maris TaxID=72806 RepID=A0ABT1HIW2_9NOCA|nr:hypothetical protein [Williamsia maris]